MGAPLTGQFPFHQIPQNLRLPLFWAEVDPSRANSNEQTQRALIIGQQLSDPTKASTVHSAVTSAGTTSPASTLTFATQPAGVQVGDYVFDTTTVNAITEGTTVTALGATITLSAPTAANVVLGDTIVFVSCKPQLMQSAAQARALYGAGSMIVEMVNRYRQNDDFGELWTIGIPDDLAAVAATCTITVQGQATAQGVISLYVNGTLVPVVVTPTMTVTDTGAAIASAINAAIDLSSQNPVGVTAQASSGVVTATARHKGAIGNDNDVRVNYYGPGNGEVLPAGVTLIITPMASGATNPTAMFTAILATLGDRPYDFIAFPWIDTTSLNTIKTFLDDVTGRWSWLKQIYGHGFTAARGTVGSLVTLGTARNDQHVTIFGFNDSPSPSWHWSSALVGACATSIRADPGMPLHGMELIGLLAPPASSQFTTSDMSTLVFDGISVSVVSPAGQVITKLIITTYQLNTSGKPDDSYLKVETMFLLTAILRYLHGRVSSKYARMKLAADGTPIPANSNIVTPAIIRAEMIAAYITMEGFGWVQADRVFAQAVAVQIDPHNPNRVNILWPGILINQLDVIALLAQFRLSPSQV